MTIVDEYNKLTPIEKAKLHIKHLKNIDIVHMNRREFEQHLKVWLFYNKQLKELETKDE